MEEKYTEKIYFKLHQIPEISLHEDKTSSFISEELKKIGYKVETVKGCLGLIAILDSQKPGPVLGVRADIDALPFSVNGKSVTIHACGHDANSSIVLGVAKYFIETGIRKGKLIFIFQPAEETLEGAKLMVEHDKLKDLEELIGIHLVSKSKLKLGEATAAVHHAATNRLRVTIRGKAAHSAYPHNGVNTIEAAVLAINSINSIKMDPTISHSIKVTKILSKNDAHNIIPDETEMVLDLRAQKNTTMKEMSIKVLEAVEHSVASIGSKVTFDEISSVPAAEYDNDMINQGENIIREVLGKVTRPIIIPGSEDFHIFTIERKLKSAYFGIGCDMINELHQPDMTFDLKALEIGRELMIKFIRKRVS